MKEKFPSSIYTYESQKNSSPDCGLPVMPMSGDFEQIINTILTNVLDDPTYDPTQAAKDLADQTNEAIELYRLSKGLK